MHLLLPPRLDTGSRRPLAPVGRLAVLLLLLATGPAMAGPSPAGAAPVRASPGPIASGSVAPPSSKGSAAGTPLPVLSRFVRLRPAPSRGVWPLRPRPAVVAGFDPPAARWSAGHRGVDLAGTPAAPVHSSLAGRVTFAGRIAGRGVVVVSHGRTRTTYEPVTAGVAVGDRVRAGAVIGRLQLFGSHCFPRWCLHWGLVEGRDRYLDPLTLVGAAPVRLLPLGDFGLLGPLLGAD